jgi:hypothetical protein
VRINATGEISATYVKNCIQWQLHRDLEPNRSSKPYKPGMYVMLLRIKFEEKYISVKTVECVENNPARLLPFGM